jgi:signal transduction histidine kinase
LVNALKFTPVAGSVTLSAGRTAHNGLIITVRDTGIGIRADNIARVLEPFVQLDETAARGAGLGLPIAVQLVEAHKGTLRIESEVGAGTSVIISLPADSARLKL